MTSHTYHVSWGSPTDYSPSPRVFTSKREAMRSATQAVRDLGNQAWAIVEQHPSPPPFALYDVVVIARWEYGGRVA